MELETAQEVCLEMREGKAKGIWKMQCYFCNKIAKNNPKKYCYYNKPNYSGCNIINSYIKKQQD